MFDIFFAFFGRKNREACPDYKVSFGVDVFRTFFIYVSSLLLKQAS